MSISTAVHVTAATLAENPAVAPPAPAAPHNWSVAARVLPEILPFARGLDICRVVVKTLRASVQRAVLQMHVPHERRHAARELDGISSDRELTPRVERHAERRAKVNQLP